MNDEPTRRATPEEDELEHKRAELSDLESQLADRELDLATLTAELSAFEREYLSTVGKRYAEIDKLKAAIAQEKYKRTPQDRRAQRERDDAREPARASASAVEESTDTATSDFRPSEALKKLYKQCARMFHPDLVSDPKEKERRHDFLTRLNTAYSNGDEAAIRQLIAEWESNPDSVSGDGIGNELVRTIRSIAAIRQRIQEIDADLSKLKESDLYRLKTKVEVARSEGKNMLARMTAELDAQIARLKKELDLLLDR